MVRNRRPLRADGCPSGPPDRFEQAPISDVLIQNFHAYATVWIVEYGDRSTLALTGVRRHKSKVSVLRRLMARISEIGLQIKRVLLDRAFFIGSVIEFLDAFDSHACWHGSCTKCSLYSTTEKQLTPSGSRKPNLEVVGETVLCTDVRLDRIGTACRHSDRCDLDTVAAFPHSVYDRSGRVVGGAGRPAIRQRELPRLLFAVAKRCPRAPKRRPSGPVAAVYGC